MKTKSLDKNFSGGWLMKTLRILVVLIIFLSIAGNLSLGLIAEAKENNLAAKKTEDDIFLEGQKIILEKLKAYAKKHSLKYPPKQFPSLLDVLTNEWSPRLHNYQEEERKKQYFELTGEYYEAGSLAFWVAIKSRAEKFIQRFKENPDAVLGMIDIPGGSFIMGSEETGSSPPHKVTLDGFRMMSKETTTEHYVYFALKNNRWTPDLYLPDDNLLPIVNVSFENAVEFCRWVGEKSGRKIRLPTEAEWEYAARAGTTTKYYWGDAPGHNNAHCTGCSRDHYKEQYKDFLNLQLEEIEIVYKNLTNLKETFTKEYLKNFKYRRVKPVGSFPPNPWGLYDMLGNAAEWVSDWYSRDYYKFSPEMNPKGPIFGDERILRGGSHKHGPWDQLKVSSRQGIDNPTIIESFEVYLENIIGFRCVEEVN